MNEIVIVGYGGHAKSVIDCIERQNQYKIAGYTDIWEHASKYKYFGKDDVLKQCFDDGIKYATIGVGFLGKGIIREKLYYMLKEIGYELPVIMDPSSIVAKSAEIGEGTFIGKGAIINVDAKIGKMAIINTKALIEHECDVGDFCHVAVSAVLCGQVKLGKSVFIGANATIIQCMNIEPDTIIPAGVIVR